MTRYDTHQLVWLVPILAWLLTVNPDLGSQALAIGTEAPITSNGQRANANLVEPIHPTGRQLEAVDELAKQMPTAPSKRWLEFASQVERPTRLGPVLLDWLSKTDQPFAQLLDSSLDGSVPEWLSGEESTYKKIAPSIQLAIAERLFLLEQYDACLMWCDGLAADAVYSEALLWYLRVVSFSMTVDYESAREAIAHLPESTWSETSPDFGLARRRTLTQIRTILEEKEPEKLKVVAKRMGDIERRLSLGQGTQPTQEQQQRVIDELDELIKELEKQQQAQQQAANSNAAPSGTPAEESRAGEYKGPGEVDRKRFSAGDPWGALSPAERERLSQGIDRDFPGHYRSLIEGYYQRLAEDESLGVDQQDQGISEQGSKR